MVVRVYMYLIGNSNALVEGIPVHNEHYAKCHATFALTADIIQAASFNVTIRNEPAPPRAPESAAAAAALRDYVTQCATGLSVVISHIHDRRVTR